jgi:hypothetical protein
MKHELIKTEDYLLVVSDEVIEDVRPYVGRYHLEKGNMIHQFPTYLTDLSECKLIIAHRPLNEAPYLDGVDVLPEIEGDLHIYDAIGYAGSEGHPDPQAFSDKQMALFQGYADGYEKAKETYKYTEDDLRNAMDWIMVQYFEFHEQPTTGRREQFIQSLNQPKLPIAFDSYTQRFADSDNILKQWDGPKTFTNSEGRTEWFGKYKFK